MAFCTLSWTATDICRIISFNVLALFDIQKIEFLTAVDSTLVLLSQWAGWMAKWGSTLPEVADEIVLSDRARD